MKTSGFHFSNSFMDPVDSISTSGLERLGSGITTDSMSLWPTIRKISSSRYKGVVPQPNGRWGAQIYEKHHRIWLGTFSVESEAAKVYDIAALKFRGRDAGTNFKSSGEDPSQTWFLSLHSKVEIVDMLRRHTYDEEFSNAKQNQAKNISALDLTSIHDGEHSMLKKREELFTKIMTPSDVGRLNRLVILKQHAEKYLPAMKREGMLLSFEDDGGRVWRFRYSYWRSSHSYEFTRGWSRFVKEKNLKPGDAVTFARSTGQDKLHYIFCTSSPDLHEFHHPSSVDQNCFLCKHLPQNDSAYSWLPHRPQTKASTPSQPPQNLVRLFGVDLHNTPAENTHAALNTNKRMREMELENCELYKRQRVLGLHCLC